MNMTIRLTFLLIFVGYLSPGQTHAQPKRSRESAIKAYIKKVDSLIAKHNTTLIKLTTAKGNIEEEKTITELTNATSSVKHNIGTFNKVIVASPNGKELYKVDYHDNHDQNFYETYYYQNNKLIAAIVTLKDETDHNVLFYKEEYYDNGVMITMDKTSAVITGKNAKRVAIPLPERANYYLSTFMVTGK